MPGKSKTEIAALSFLRKKIFYILFLKLWYQDSEWNQLTEWRGLRSEGGCWYDARWW